MPDVLAQQHSVVFRIPEMLFALLWEP